MGLPDIPPDELTAAVLKRRRLSWVGLMQHHFPIERRWRLGQYTRLRRALTAGQVGACIVFTDKQQALPGTTNKLIYPEDDTDIPAGHRQRCASSSYVRRSENLSDAPQEAVVVSVCADPNMCVFPIGGVDTSTAAHRTGLCFARKAKRHFGIVRCMDGIKNADLLASAGDDFSVKVWSLQHRLCVSEWRVSRLVDALAIDAASVAAAQPRVACAVQRTAVQLWDVYSRKCLLEIITNSSMLSLRCDGDIAVVSTDGGGAKVYDLRTGKGVRSLVEPTDVRALLLVQANTGNAPLIATGSRNAVRLWDLRNSGPLQSAATHCPVTALVRNRYDLLVAAGSPRDFEIFEMWGPYMADNQPAMPRMRSLYVEQQPIAFGLGCGNRYVHAAGPFSMAECQRGLVVAHGRQIELWDFVDGSAAQFPSHRRGERATSIAEEQGQEIQCSTEQTKQYWRVSTPAGVDVMMQS